MPSLLELAKRLIGVSTYVPEPTIAGPGLDDKRVQQARKMSGGNLQQLPSTKLRWYIQDLETAQFAADRGNMQQVGQLYRAMRRDGTISGLLDTRSSGLVRLPRRFAGKEAMIAALTANTAAARSVFDETFPPSELKLLDQDGIVCGVGAAELVPVPGRANPIMLRVDPEWLDYQWNEGRWYYRSVAGRIPITPGDGRWILHTPGGRQSPWQFGQWIACGEGFITKQHARLHRANYGGKLANPARVVHAPLGADEPSRRTMLERAAAWGVNTVLSLPVGWDLDLVESKGEGSKVWLDDEASANTDIKMALAGQEVTSDGGSGFINGDLFKNIRSDLIQTDGDELALTINTQGMPALCLAMFGGRGLDNVVTVRWDTTPPQDLQREASTMQTVAAAVTALNGAVKSYGYRVDVPDLARRFGLALTEEAAAVLPPSIADIKAAVELAKANGYRPTPASIEAMLRSYGLDPEAVPQTSSNVRLTLAPTDVAVVVKGVEARGSQGLLPFGDERDELTIEQIRGASKAAAEPGAPVAGAEPSPVESVTE